MLTFQNGKERDAENDGSSVKDSESTMEVAEVREVS